MSGKRDEQRQRVAEFLKTLDRLKESGIIFSSTVLKRDIQAAVTDFFTDIKLVTLDDSIGIKEKIDGLLISSLREGNPLFISLSLQSLPVVTRRIEQILKDGYIEEATPGGRTRVTPANGWYSIVWVDISSFKEQEPLLRELFGYRLTL